MKVLERSLGLGAVVAISISAMLGSGIFVLPGLAAGKAGAATWIAYLLAGFAVLPAALSKSELATAMPSAGGSYVFLERSFGPLAGTIAGVTLWASMLLKSAFALVGFGAYLYVFAPNVSVQMTSIVLLVGVVSLNILGVKKVGRVQVVVVTIAIAGLLLMAAMGIGSIERSNLTPVLSHGYGGLLSAAAFVFVAYDGVTKVAAIAEEVKDPGRNIPLGILISLGIVTVLYSLVVLVLVGNVPHAQLQQDLRPVFTLGERLGGPTVGLVVAVLGVVTMTSMATAGLLAASRFPFAMGREELAPAFLKQVHSRFKTPVTATLLTGVVMAAAIAFLDVNKMAKLASAMVMMIFIAENIAVLVFRETRVHWYQPSFRSPLYPWLQVFGVVSGLALLAMIGVVALAAVLAVLLPGALLYVVYGRSRVTRRGVLGKLGRRQELLEKPGPESAEPAPQSVGPDLCNSEVLVALLGQERSAEMLVEMGAALGEGRSVDVVHLTEIPEQMALEDASLDEPFIQGLKRRIGALSEEQELDITFHSVVSRDLTRTVHDLSKQHCSWLLMAWHGREGQTLLPYSPLGWLINHLQTDLAMFRDWGIYRVRKIMVLPTPGPNDTLVVDTADHLARRYNAEITLVRFSPEEASEAHFKEQQGYLSELARCCKSPSHQLVLRGEKMRSSTSSSALPPITTCWSSAPAQLPP